MEEKLKSGKIWNHLKEKMLEEIRKEPTVRTSSVVSTTSNIIRIDYIKEPTTCYLFSPESILPGRRYCERTNAISCWGRLDTWKMLRKGHMRVSVLKVLNRKEDLELSVLDEDIPNLGRTLEDFIQWPIGAITRFLQEKKKDIKSTRRAVDIDQRSEIVKKGYYRWMAREDCAMTQFVDFKKEIFLDAGDFTLPINPTYIIELLNGEQLRTNILTLFSRRSMEIGLSTKRKLGFVKGTIPKPAVLHVTSKNYVARAINAVNIEMWATCNNLVIMSSICVSIAKSVMFISTVSEIWSQLETRFSISNGSRKYKLSKDVFRISQQGVSVSEYYTKMNAIEKQKEEQMLFQFLNGLDDCYRSQRSQLLLINPLPSVENACAVIQQEESQKDVFNFGLPMIESTALLNKSMGKDKCLIYGFKWHPPDKSAPKRTAANVTSGSNSFTFTSKQFENLMRNVLKDMKPGASIGDCIDEELEFVAERKVQGLGRKIGGLHHLLNVHIDQVDAKLKMEVENIDDFSEETWTYLMVHKSDALEIIKAFLKFVELQFSTKVKCIRSDNALDFVKGPCALYLASQGIKHQTTCVDRPQQNGRVERKHRHILEVARALRFQAKHVFVFPNIPEVLSFNVPTSSTTTNTEAPVRKSSRSSKPPSWTKDFMVPTLKPSANQVTTPTLSLHFFCFPSTLVTQQDPKAFKEAFKDTGWCEAMNAKLRALEENGIWELVDLPQNKKAIDSD
ncbi:cysteamine dioxygenase [Tanacetum coccineum]